MSAECGAILSIQLPYLQPSAFSLLSCFIAILLLPVVAMGLAGCATAPHDEPQVDHVILGISSLDAGVREFEALTGVHATFGGQHPGRGTHNALIALGSGTYLEIIAPRPDAKLEGNLADLAKLDHLTPIGWAVRTTDIAASRSRLAREGFRTSEPRAGSRATPTGAVLRWSTFTIEEPRHDTAPFFIHWDDMTTHPSKTSPEGCTLDRLEVEESNASLRIPLVASDSKTPSIALTLRCGTRTVRFPR